MSWLPATPAAGEVAGSNAGAFRPSGHRRFLILSAMAMLAFVAASNRWVSWSDAVGRYHDGDPISYRAIAAAAPGLPHHRLAEWHAERFIPNYLVGCAAKLLHVGLTSTYRVACVAVAVAICLVLAELLSRLALSRASALVCLAAFIFNPYGLRYFFFGVGRIADLVFILGALLAVRGVALRAPVSLLAGALIATTARQTILPAALVAAVAVLTDPGWGARLGPRLAGSRVLLAASVAAIPLVVYAAIRIIAAPFSGPNPSLETMTILGADSVKALLEHFARSTIPLLPVSALLAAAWWASRSNRLTAPAEQADPLWPGRAAAYSCLVFGAAIALQPFLLNPPWVSDSEPRLAVLGLAPLAVALGLFLADLERNHREELGAGVARALVGLLAVGSLHHIFTRTGPADKAQTVTLQTVAAVAVGALLLSCRLQRAPARIGQLRRDGLQSTDRLET